MTLAGLLVFLWLFVATLAASHSLHQYFHHGADSSQHTCAVTVVEQGKFVFHAPAPVFAATPQAIGLEPARAVSVSPPAVSHRLAPGRAPPTA